MSTPELCADEPHVVGRIADLPDVNGEGNETNQVAGHGNPVQASQLFDGRRTFFGLAKIFDVMHGFDFRSEYVAAEKPKREKRDQEGKAETAKGFSHVNHFREEVADGDDATDKVQRKISADELLSDEAEIIITQGRAGGREYLPHLIAEDSRGDAEREEKRRPEPQGGVEDSNDAQNNDHGQKAIGLARTSQAFEQAFAACSGTKWNSNSNRF
jgi:hypothetical protein